MTTGSGPVRIEPGANDAQSGERRRSFPGARVRVGSIQFASIVLAFASIFFAVPVFKLYRIFYFAYFGCIWVTGVLLVSGKLRVRGLVKSTWPLWLFWGYLLASVAWAAYPQATVTALALELIFPSILVLAFVSAQNNPPNRLAQLFELVPLFVISFVLISVVRASDSWEFEDRLRAASNLMGMHLCASIPFLLRRYHLKKRASALALLATTFALLCILPSRSSIIASLFSGCVAMVDLEAHKRRVILRFAQFGLLLIAVVLGIWLVEPLNQIAGHALERFSEQTNLSFLDAEAEFMSSMEPRVDIERRLLWLTAYRVFLERPWSGIGYMNMEHFFEDTYGWRVSSHGLVTTLLAETGIIGFVLFIPLLWLFFARMQRAICTETELRKTSFYRACRDSMAGLLIAGLFHQLQQMQLLYVLLGWGYAASDSDPRKAGR